MSGLMFCLLIDLAMEKRLQYVIDVQFVDVAKVLFYIFWYFAPIKCAQYCIFDLIYIEPGQFI